MKNQLIKRYHYHLAVNETDSSELEDSFRVTPREGIIYLDNTERLSMLKSASMVTLHIFARTDVEVPLLLAKISVTVFAVNGTSVVTYNGLYSDILLYVWMRSKLQAVKFYSRESRE
jgi:hypothetical protein